MRNRGIAAIVVVGLLLVAILGLANLLSPLSSVGSDQTSTGRIEESELGPNFGSDLYLLSDSPNGSGVRALEIDGASAKLVESTGSDPLVVLASVPGIRTATYGVGGVLSGPADDEHAWLANETKFGSLDLKTGRFTNVNVPVASLRTPPDSGAASIPGSYDRPRITSLAVDGVGAVWLTQDYARVLFRYDHTAKSFQEVDGPQGMRNPTEVLSDGSDLIVRDARPASFAKGAPQPWSMRTPTGWRDGIAEGPIVAGRSRFWKQRSVRGKLYSLDSRGESTTDLTSVVASQQALDVITSDATSTIWALEAPSTVVMFDQLSRKVVTYTLPMDELRGVSVPFGMAPPSSEARSPMILSFHVDSAGNLWLFYKSGYGHLVRLIRE